MITQGEYNYLESGGSGETILLLHGLFGGLSNFGAQIDYFQHKYNVVAPLLPMFALPLRKVSIVGLVDHLIKFIEHKGYERVHLMGNSLGGHVAILYALEQSDRVASITLTGSSGLFESAFGNSFPPRSNRDFIRKRVEQTLFSPEIVTEEMVDEVYDTVNDRNKGIRIIMTAKSAVRNNLANKLDKITVPTLLIWGNQDTITPPFVAEQFHELIPHSELHFLDECGHAPMMELPDRFNAIMGDFLARASESPGRHR